MPAKKRKPQPPKKRKAASSSFKLLPFKENMDTGESYVPRKKKAKAEATTYTPMMRNPWDAIDILELEELTRPTPIPVDIEDSGFRRFLKAVVYYGLSSMMTLALATLVAWYVLEIKKQEPVRMLRNGKSIIFAVGEDSGCRVIIETAPTSTDISINSTPILSKTPVKLLLPCQKRLLVSLTAPGFIPVAQMIRPADKQFLRVKMLNGEPTIVDTFKFDVMNALQPFLTATHQVSLNLRTLNVDK